MNTCRNCKWNTDKLSQETALCTNPVINESMEVDYFEPFEFLPPLTFGCNQWEDIK
jgi:hypothetical protein